MSTLGLHRGPYKGMFVKDLDTDLSFISRRRAITTSLDKEQHLCSFVERNLNAMIGQMPLFWLVNVIGGLKATRQHHVEAGSIKKHASEQPSLTIAIIQIKVSKILDPSEDYYISI